MHPTLLALLHRDLRVARREFWFFILRVGVQPLLFTFIFGYVMPRQGIVARGYTSLLLPGILALSMTLSGMQAVALPLVIEFGWTKEIEDRLLAPISIAGVAFEKILMGLFQALVAGLVVLPIAWAIMEEGLNFKLAHPVLLVSVAVLTGWVFSAFGLVLGTITAPQQIGLVFNVVARADDLLRLRLLSVGNTEDHPVVPEARSRQPARLRERGLPRRRDRSVAAHAPVGSLRRAYRFLGPFHLSGVAQFRAPRRRLIFPAILFTTKTRRREESHGFLRVFVSSW